MRETEPVVRLIARPQIDWTEVGLYLQDVGGVDWYERMRPRFDVHTGKTTFFQSDAEALAEFAGRGCYRSWAPGLNANVTKVRDDSGDYLRNIVKSKHGSVLEHLQYTFVFQDVSRVFTHELVRHRAGVAISQESLRYVRLTDLGFRIPPQLDRPDLEMPSYDSETRQYRTTKQDNMSPMNVREAVISIVERLEEFQRDAADAFGLDDEGVPFHYKKEVTSALRRLAPLGLSTMMTWSANVRTLRHLITMRTAAGAEEEIRLVFDQVARVMRTECPNLFGDFSEVWATDEIKKSGIPEWVPEFEKV